MQYILKKLLNESDYEYIIENECFTKIMMRIAQEWQTSK